jgi:hypothetical protein
MLELACPSCGATVEFKSKASTFGVCRFCKSSLVRQDLKLDLIGKMAELQEDLSPLQIGTRGRYEQKSFEVVGRMRLAWKDGFWNEWYVVFNGDKTGWIAEAQGTWALSTELNPLPQLPTVDEVALKDRYQLQGQTFEVMDLKIAHCIGSEGELPVAAVATRSGKSVDLIGPDNRFASIEYAASETRAFLGEYVDFDSFEFTNLRPLYGWRFK